MIVTIAICTYNRSYYLKKCIDALLPQIEISPDHVKIMVIDNNSIDDTAVLINNYKNNHIDIDYFKETDQGLSYARNRAIKECNTAYLGYLDDDAIPNDDYIPTLLNIIHEHHPDCFGGTYYAYYENQKPKWLSDSFGSKVLLSDHPKKIETGFLSGGNMYFKLHILKELKGFDVTKGMKGNKIGYAEEDDLQLRLRKAGYSIFFDPHLAMVHLVANYKTKVFWHIKKAYVAGKSTVSPIYEHYDLKNTMKALIKMTFIQMPRKVKCFLLDKDFFYQNLLIDVFAGYARIIGLWRNDNK